MAKNDFDNFIEKSKQNEIEIPKTHSKASKQSYKTVRIYPDDFEIIREIAFKERKTIVEVISEMVHEKHK